MVEHFAGLSAIGNAVPPEMMGELVDNTASLSEPETLQPILAEQGYLYLRGVLDCEAVFAARAEVFARLGEIGELNEPFEDGISSGTSRREEMVGNLADYWRSVCEGPALRAVTHGGPMAGIMEKVLGEAVRPFDFLWLRTMHPGKASAFHFDHVYMNRGSDRLLTVWTPLGDVPVTDGPILLIEGSHLWEDLVEEYRGFDVDKNTERPGHVTLDPVSLAQEREARLLTADFKAGDVLIMTMFILHGSLDNLSPINRVRLSGDVRYQPAADPIDERWVGPNPIAHGKGYGSVGGSRPATSAAVRR